MIADMVVEQAELACSPKRHLDCSHGWELRKIRITYSLNVTNLFDSRLPRQT